MVGILFVPTRDVLAGDGQVDVASLPFMIEGPGSYIVVSDLHVPEPELDGITIAADNVTLDLNGHTVAGFGKSTGTNGDGIVISGARQNITIRNGTVRDWRQEGVDANSAYSSRFEELHLYNNGGIGLRTGDGAIIASNTCSQNGSAGISCGDGSSVEGNTCRGNGFDGVVAGRGSTVGANSCSYNGRNGILTLESTVRENTCTYNSGDGIEVDSDCLVTENTCNRNGYNGDGAGIHATGSNNSIENNQASRNDRGIHLAGTGNSIAENHTLGNTTPILALADNQLEVLISELPYAIPVPGSYRLSGRLRLTAADTDGITINANNVTLDLGGHALVGPGKSTGTTGSGVNVPSTHDNITVRNGTLRDWRLHGAFCANSENGRFENLRCSENGFAGVSAGANSLVQSVTSQNNLEGVRTSEGCIVRDCVCSDNSGDGIVAGPRTTVKNCSATDNGAVGINCWQGCTITDNNCHGNLHGITAGTDSRVVGNNCSNNGDGDAIGHGIYVDVFEGSVLIADNVASHNTQDGIYAGSYAKVTDNVCNWNGNDGITVDTGCFVTGNSCDINYWTGIEMSYNCQVSNNSCVGNGYPVGPGAGIRVDYDGYGNTIASNLVAQSAFGILCNPGQENYIITNRARWNGTDYDIQSGNTLGTGDLANISY